ncbi:MAG: gamma carbonic anhydrase family protein [Pseudomonadota bacterium]
MTLYALDGRHPSLEEPCWVAPGAQVIGDVRVGREATVWFNAVLRGDNEPITIGAGSNVQDGCVLHTDLGFALTLEEDVTVGHAAVLHGCFVGRGSLIGMGATVLNGARIGRGCLIGANALVGEGKEIPDRSMVLGVPAKVVRTLDEAASAALAQVAAGYRARLGRYREGLEAL